MTDELTCKELVELVTDYLDGSLDPPERRRFEEHLVFCDGCFTYLDQVRETVTLVGRLSEENLPEPAREGLLEAFRGWNRGVR